MNKTPPAGPDELPPLPGTMRFVSRSEWGSEELQDGEGEGSEGGRTSLSLPVEYVRYTTTKDRSCNSIKQCCAMLKKIQTKAREDDYLTDVPYNFLVDEQGVVYEGRGWFKEAYRPEQYDYLGGKAIDIAYIGEYGKKSGKPSLMAVRAADTLVQYGHQNGLIKHGKKEVGYNS